VTPYKKYSDTALFSSSPLLLFSSSPLHPVTPSPLLYFPLRGYAACFAEGLRPSGRFK
jgi:hypothetical protein